MTSAATSGWEWGREWSGSVYRETGSDLDREALFTRLGDTRAVLFLRGRSDREGVGRQRSVSVAHRPAVGALPGASQKTQTLHPSPDLQAPRRFLYTLKREKN